VAFEKHRDETRAYELDFANDLATGETISSITSVKIRKRISTGWSDVTTEFGTLSPAISTTKVQFTLNAAASATVQLAGVYRVYAEIVTSQSLTKVGTRPLTVTARASV
jgi:hypothetical protein